MMTGTVAKIGRAGIAVLSLVVILVTAVTVGAMIAGYRPVVLQTGSMGDYAPAGSLVVAAPRAAPTIEVGDVVVMRRPGVANVTHRVIEIEHDGEHRFAITKGDANEAPDATPYPLDGTQLVVRWAYPDWGWRLQSVLGRGVVVPLMAIAVFVVTIGALRRIWASGPAAVGEDADADTASTDTANATTDGRSGARRFVPKSVAALAVPVLALGSGGVAWAMFSSSEDVSANSFSTPDCFDAQLGSVQTGELVHAVDGALQVAITAVDPTSSFVLLSVSSAGGDPSDATVMGRLTGGGTTLEVARNTDAPTPPAVIVAWTVVEFGCGVNVQRGTVAGNGTSQIDVPVPNVDPTRSFALVTSMAAGGDTDFDGDDLFIAELTGSANLRIRSNGGPSFSPQRTFAWQIVTFVDSGDLTTQTASTTLAAGMTTGTITLPEPADPATTFIITGVASAGSGPGIGERMIRTHLSSPTTVDVSRLVGGDQVEVHVQAVTLRDGTTVRHGTVDLGPGIPVQTIAIDAVDPARSSVIATVQIPGAMAGGSTDFSADDTVAEASATFSLTDPTTVTVSRGATTSTASFGWQVIEWAGPTWWDPGYLYRQRIDVAATTAAPDQYTVPVNLDHAALVASGLSASDGADVRIVGWDGTAWTELDRVLDDASGWNQATTTLWFRTRTPIPSSATVSYWLYFGNGSPGPVVDDPEQVYALHEGFESATLGDFEDRTGGTAWYDSSPWTRRVPITVPAAQITADLVDFPLLVSVTTADLAANARTDGADIRFTAADGVTPLAHEIESWDKGSGALVSWLNVPIVSSTSDTVVFLYYGAADAAGQADVRATWPTAFEASWHLGRNPAGVAPQADDSTVGNHDGLSSGSMTPGDLVAGLIGRGLDLDGIDDRLDIAPFDLGGAAGLTVSGWVRLDAYGSPATVVAKSSNTTGPIADLSITATGALEVTLALGNAPSVLISADAAVGLGAWHHVAATWDGGILRLLVDGVEVGGDPATGSIVTDPPGPVTIGARADSSGHLDGVLDEVRIERVARDPAWLAALVANHTNPTALAVPGAPQSGAWLDHGDWQYRKPLTLSGAATAGTVTDHPVLVEIVDAELQAKARNDGLDVVFTDADGTSRLPHVVERFDGATGALSAWIAVPSLETGVDATVYLYYGNPNAGDQQWPEAVFGPDADLATLFE